MGATEAIHAMLRHGAGGAAHGPPRKHGPLHQADGRCSCSWNAFVPHAHVGIIVLDLAMGVNAVQCHAGVRTACE